MAFEPPYPWCPAIASLPPERVKEHTCRQYWTISRGPNTGTHVCMKTYHSLRGRCKCACGKSRRGAREGRIELKDLRFDVPEPEDPFLPRD